MADSRNDIYDTYGHTQLKVGPGTNRQFNVGDKVEIADGVYLGREGIVVIVGGVFIAEEKKLLTKWNDLLNRLKILDKHDPILKAIQDFHATQSVTDAMRRDS